jgi:hypothetical protein
MPAFVRAGESDSDDSGAAKSSWFRRLLPGKSQPPPKPKDQKTEKAEAAGKYAALMKSHAAAQAREKSDWLRRVAVCDKLREIALLTGDDELLRKADQLDHRAWDTYQKRTASVSPGSAGLQSDERILDRRLGTSMGQSLLRANGTGSVSQASLPGGRQ